MKRLSLATCVLSIVGIAYVLGEGWLLYQQTPALSRDLFLILIGYGIVLAALTAAIVLSIRIKGSSGP